VYAQLSAGTAQVGLDGLRAQRQPLRRLGVAAAERDLAQHVEFPGRQRRRPARAGICLAVGRVVLLQPRAGAPQPRPQPVVVELSGDAEQLLAQVTQVTGGEPGGMPGDEGGGLQHPDPAVHLVSDGDLGGEPAGDRGQRDHRPLAEREHRADRGVQHPARGPADGDRRGDDGPDALAPHLRVVVVGDVRGRDIVIEGDRTQLRDGVPADPAAVLDVQAGQVVGLRTEELLEHYVVPVQLPAEGQGHTRLVPRQAQGLPVGGSVVGAQHVSVRWS
jgi:hypothetical protein